MVEGLGGISNGRQKLRVCDSVVISGLKSAPQLNGVTGVLTGYSEDSGRWVVQLPGDKGSKKIKPENLKVQVDSKSRCVSVDSLPDDQATESILSPCRNDFRVCDSVTIVGLIGDEELNGAVGTLIEYCEDEGCWTVQLPSGCQRIKPTNLRPHVAGVSQPLCKMDRWRILCIHGRSANAEVMQFQMTVLKHRLQSMCDFHYVEGPFQAASLDKDILAGGFQPPFFTWYVVSDNAAERKRGMTKVIKQVSMYLREHGPFHGIVGFSTGAGIAALLCKVAQSPEMFGPEWCGPGLPNFCAFILSVCGANLPREELFAGDKIKIPLINLIGKHDFNRAQSHQLGSYFEISNVLEHSEGHRFPDHRQDKAVYDKVVEAIKKHCNEWTPPSHMDLWGGAQPKETRQPEDEEEEDDVRCAVQ